MFLCRNKAGPYHGEMLKIVLLSVQWLQSCFLEFIGNKSGGLINAGSKRSPSLHFIGSKCSFNAFYFGCIDDSLSMSADLATSCCYDKQQLIKDNYLHEHN